MLGLLSWRLPPFAIVTRMGRGRTTDSEAADATCRVQLASALHGGRDARSRQGSDSGLAM